jgi:vancomycin permeability regulator SanA
MKKKMKEKKNMILKIICICLFLLFVGILIVGGINLYIISKEKGKIITIEESANINADCIIVLGAGIKADGSPTWMLEDRIKTGIQLYNVGASEKLLMSGDHGRDEHDEVNTMKSYAINECVPSEDIFMDHAGFETYDSMYRAKKVFGAKKVIIVTQGYHLYRALYIAEQLGLEAYGVDANLRYYSNKMVYWKFRESLARVKAFVKCISKPEPKYLGDTIDITANGDVTND